MITFVKVKNEVDGIHRYPIAANTHSYLREMHRHKFYITAKVQVFHLDREIEFFELKDNITSYIKNNFVTLDKSSTYDFGTKSCEMLATGILNYLSDLYNSNRNRQIVVTVSEDNENESEVDNRDSMTQNENYDKKFEGGFL